MEGGKKPVIMEKKNEQNITMNEEESNRNTNSVDEYIDSLPPGVWFRPTDEELVEQYLKKKVFNEPLPKNRFRDINLSSYTPDQLSVKYHLLREKEWYFFTPRIKKYARGNRPNRSAGNGFWKATGGDTAIFRNGEIVGYKKALVFYEGSRNGGREGKTHWLMYEYRLARENIASTSTSTTTLVDKKLDDWVLCKIYYNRRHKQDGEERYIVADQHHHHCHHQQQGGEELIRNERPANAEKDHHQQQQGGEELVRNEGFANAEPDHQQQQPHDQGDQPSLQLPTFQSSELLNYNMYGMFGFDGGVDLNEEEVDNIFASLGELPPVDSVLAPNMLDFYDPDDAFHCDVFARFHGKL